MRFHRELVGVVCIMRVVGFTRKQIMLIANYYTVLLVSTIYVFIQIHFKSDRSMEN